METQHNIIKNFPLEKLTPCNEIEQILNQYFDQHITSHILFLVEREERRTSQFQREIRQKYYDIKYKTIYRHIRDHYSEIRYETINKMLDRIKRRLDKQEIEMKDLKDKLESYLNDCV